MASWRVGYMVAPESLWSAITKIQDTLLICPPVVSQHAALAALGVGRRYTAAPLQALAGVRQLVFDALSDPGVPCDVPPAGGAFYYFLRVPSTMTPIALVERLIRDHYVAAMPGSAFGDTHACSLRISYGALDRASVGEGIARLAAGLRALVRA
jgi:aspartate/methionine/tyrosine aminotransferase